MAQPKPKVGDIWKDNMLGDKWLVLDKYIHRGENTHFLTLRNFSTDRLRELAAVYIRQKWEFIA